MTLADAQDHLSRARDAYNKALSLQEYNVTGPTGGGRQVRRADLAVLAQEVERWERKVVTLTRGGIRVRRGVAI